MDSLITIFGLSGVVTPFIGLIMAVKMEGKRRYGMYTFLGGIVSIAIAVGANSYRMHSIRDAGFADEAEYIAAQKNGYSDGASYRAFLSEQADKKAADERRKIDKANALALDDIDEFFAKAIAAIDGADKRAGEAVIAASKGKASDAQVYAIIIGAKTEIGRVDKILGMALFESAMGQLKTDSLTMANIMAVYAGAVTDHYDAIMAYTSNPKPDLLAKMQKKSDRAIHHYKRAHEEYDQFRHKYLPPPTPAGK